MSAPLDALVLLPHASTSRSAPKTWPRVRPELGHATNAITIVGRREWTRGLFLDRRAFLTSYDPTEDDAELRS